MSNKSLESTTLRRQRTANAKAPALKPSPVNMDRILKKMQSEREKYAARPILDTAVTDLRKDWTRR